MSIKFPDSFWCKTGTQNADINDTGSWKIPKCRNPNKKILHRCITHAWRKDSSSGLYAKEN